MIAVVDSGSANLGSVYKALIKTGLDAEVTDKPSVIKSASGIVFPGVGAFEHAVRLLKIKGLDEVLIKVIESGKPFLGICLGLQLLMSFSEERSSDDVSLPAGINAVPGKVIRFPSGLPVPHVGWNRAFARKPHPLMTGLPEGSYFYFTHSYYVKPDKNDVILTETYYNESFVSSIARGNIMGVQFHPEKSGPAGLQLLNNFGKIVSNPSGLIK